MLQKRPLSSMPAADATITCHICGQSMQNITLCGGGSFLSVPRRLRIYSDSQGSTIMESMVFACPHCDARYLHPRPSAEALEQHYRNAKVLHGTNTLERYLARIQSSGNDDYVVSMLKWLEDRFSVSVDFIRTGLMIDVGCNAAGLLRAAMDRGIRCLGIEVDAELCELNREHIKCDVFSGMFENVPDTYSESASLVVLRDSLEHHLDPAQSLRIAHRLLKPGGMVFVDVPNFDCVLVQHNLEAFDWFEADHMFYFSNRALINALTIAGFSGADTCTPVGDIDYADAALTGIPFAENNKAYTDMLLTEKLSRKLWCAGIKKSA